MRMMEPLPSCFSIWEMARPEGFAAVGVEPGFVGGALVSSEVLK